MFGSLMDLVTIFSGVVWKGGCYKFLAPFLFNIPFLLKRSTYHDMYPCEHKDTWTGEDDMLLNIKCLSAQFIPSYILICMVYTFTNIISLNGSKIPNVFLCNSYVHANLFAWF